MTTEEDRIQIVELSNRGVKASEVAQQLGCSVWTVRKWKQRFKKRKFTFGDGTSQKWLFI